jgi:hypothetical protein
VNGQLGSENTPDAFIERLVCVFREVRRVLRSDGVAWLNIGDSYAQDTKWGGSTGGKHSVGLHGTTGIGRQRTTSGLPGKNQMLIPFRLAIALQCDGWWVRSTIIWSKPNPMPASVTDRPTDSHEYIFLLTKSADYWYDQDAIREPHAESTGPRAMRGRDTAHKHVNGAPGQTAHSMNAPRPNRNHKNVQYDGQQPNGMHVKRANGDGDPDLHPLGRNKRSVWTVPTAPSTWEYCGACSRLYEGQNRRDLIKRIDMVDGEEVQRKVCLCGRYDAWVQHFAAYPEDLITPCILAGTPHKVCADCGAPYERISETNNPSKYAADSDIRDFANTHQRTSNPQSSKSLHRNQGGVYSTKVLLGWRKTCGCLTTATRPGIVLDPFFGSGTTGIVAKKWARHWLGIELNPDYVRVGQARCAVPVTLPMFLEV